MPVIRYFLHNGIAVAVLCLAILLFGLLAVTSLPIQLTPNVQTPAITVSTSYPGATPQDVEQDILVEQEEFLRGVDGLRKMTSTASLGRAEIILEFPVGYDLSEALIRVSNALAQVPSYPENVDEPSLSTSSTSDQPVAWFSIRALPGKELEVDVRKQFDFAEDNIKTQFERIPGVASVQGVYGGSSKEMQVHLEPAAMAERGVTIYDVREAIRNNNRDVPGGDLEEGKRSYNVRTEGRFNGPLDVENTIIKYEDETPLYIRDVGYARVGTGEERSMIRHNGRPALAFGVRHEPGTNLLLVMEEVKQLAKTLNETTLRDRGLFLTQVTDDTEYVEASVAMVRNNLFIGGILATLVLMIFLRNIRSTLVISVAVPLCIAGSLFLISAMGRTINVVTLAGLAFSIGAVLDNSIVVLENIYRHRTMGKNSEVAALDGTSEVWVAIFSSAVTNVVVFVPIITLEEQAGQLFRDLAIAITATNIFSFLVAILVIPCIAAALLHKMPTEPKPAWKRAMYHLYGADKIAVGFYNTVDRMLQGLMRSPLARLAVVAGTVGVAAALIFVFLPKTEYLPEGNQNSIFGLMIPPQGYAIDEMSAIGLKLEEDIRPYVEAPVGSYARGELDAPAMRDFFFVAIPGNMFVFTRAKDPALANEVPGTLVRYFSQVPGVIPISMQRSIFDPGLSGSRGIELDIIGPDIITTTQLAARTFGKVIEVFGEPPRPEPGIEIGKPQLTIRPRWERARELGISASAVGYGAWVLGNGAYADDYYEDGRKYDLYLYSTMGAFDTLSSFDTLRIATDDGGTVPLADVADVTFDFVPEQIRRVDESRAVTLTITPPMTISLEEAIETVRTDIVGALREEGAIPAGYAMRIGGSSDKLSAVREALAGDLILAILLVYLVLVLILRHWGHPFTILMSIPIGMTGGVLGLQALNIYLYFLTGGTTIQSLDVLTMLGFVILLGSIVNNPILIVEQALNFHKNDGLDIHDAVREAALSRIRPIFMTTSTTILGLAPLVLLPGAGTELYRGLGMVMFGGLLLGTVVCMIFIPCLMALLFDFTGAVKRTAFGDRSSVLLKKLQEG